MGKQIERQICSYTEEGTGVNGLRLLRKRRREMEKDVGTVVCFSLMGQKEVKVLTEKDEDKWRQVRMHGPAIIDI